MDMGGVTWIVAADGVKCRVFEERQRFGEVVERGDFALSAEPADSHPHHQSATVHDRFGFGRHKAGERPWKDERTQRFLRRVAWLLDQAAERKRYDKLVLIAPPRALGHLREALSHAAAERLEATDAHDCVRETSDEIRTRLRTIRALT